MRRVIRKNNGKIIHYLSLQEIVNPDKTTSNKKKGFKNSMME